MKRTKVTIDGIEYPSCMAASWALQMGNSTLHRIIKAKGTELSSNDIHDKKHRSLVIEGREYYSIAAAMRATGLGREKVLLKYDPDYKRKAKEYSQQSRWVAYRRQRNGLPAPTRPCPERCECCHRLFSETKKGAALDHDHQTGTFRGWLCGRCNTGIGMLGDNVQGIMRAMGYLTSINGELHAR